MEIKLNQVYKHFKGDLYLVLELAKHSETLEEFVVYRQLYGECKVWVRPIKMWSEELPLEKQKQYGQKHRFELQDIKSKK
jgi:hypothetical protein